MTAPESFPHAAEPATALRPKKLRRGPNADAANPIDYGGTPSSPVTVFAHRNESNADRLGVRTAQLRALVSSMTGSGFENFQELNDTLQGNLMWLVDELVDEVEALALRVCERDTPADA